MNQRIIITRAACALKPDGVNTFIFELGSAFVRKGFDTYVVSGYGPSFSKAQVSKLFDVDLIPKVICLRKDPFKSRIEETLFWIARGVTLLNSLRPDIVIMNGIVPCWIKALNIAVCHGLKTHGYYPALNKLYNFFMYRMGFSIIAVSRQLKCEIANELKIKNVRVIPIGLDIRKYSLLPLGQREKAILHVGTRLVKNLPTTLKAFEIISKKLPETKLYIAGSNIVKYRRLIKNEMKDRVRFLGVIGRQELRALYSKVRVVSTPSFYEAFPYVALEAFASGTPVIGSKAVSKELLIENYNGYRIASPENYQELSDKMLDLLLDDSKWKFLSLNAKNTVSNYDIAKIADEYLFTVWKDI
jgi:glycosyltransferase involved in cell wall biosynthesis